jgi:hypothetical protein
MATIKLEKDSFQTLYLKVQYQPSVTASVTAYNLASTTSEFVAAVSMDQSPVIKKSSTAISEISYLNQNTGEMEIYILPVDTTSLAAGVYYYSVYITDSDSRTHVVANSKFKLIDTVNPS